MYTRKWAIAEPELPKAKTVLYFASIEGGYYSEIINEFIKWRIVHRNDACKDSR